MNMILEKKSILFLFIAGSLLFSAFPALCGESASPINDNEDFIWETVPLVYNGGFELFEKDTDTVSLLNNWKCSSVNTENKISLDNETYLSGKSSLRVEGNGEVSVKTEDIPIPAGMVSITGSIFYRGTFPSKVVIEWLNNKESIEKKELRLIENAGSEWKRFMLSEIFVPSGTIAVRFRLITEFNTAGTVWWDEANFTGIIEKPKTIDIFVNQVGYDLLYPKTCILATNFKPEGLTSYLLGDSDREIREIHFGEPSRIVGIHKSDWGKWFCRADFSDYNEEGNYRIVVIIGEKRYYSPSFLIGKDLLWGKTVPRVLEGIRLHRCGTKIEGIHELCHADDSFEGISLKGGWHDGETYSKTKSALCLNLLAESYNICMWRLLKDKDLASKLREEIDWGAEYIVHRIKEDGTLLGNIFSKPENSIRKPEEETDNQLNTADERPIEETVSDEEFVISALGNVAYLSSKINPESPYINKAEKLTQSVIVQGKKNWGLFSALVYLEEIKNIEKNISVIQSCVPENILNVSEAIPRYDAFTYENKTYELVQSLQNAIQLYSEQANQNPFGICPMKWKPEVDFFGITTKSEEGVKGNNLYILQIAQLAGKAFRFIPEDTTKRLFFDHINWVLGVNPYGICFIEGLGSKNLPVYAHPYVKTGIDSRKLVGVIPFGIRATSKNSDAPYLDLSSSNPDMNSAGISIETLALYINALAHFYRVRIHAETPTRPE
ncbi:MAG: hypothetical protein ACP5QY_02055 [Candidatus Hydrogenedens sp.]